jgi:hypothetical protein
MSPEPNFQEQEDHQVAPKNEPGGWEELILAAGLSVRATNVLLKNFSSCDEFLSLNVISFGDLRNCGRKTIRELIEFRDGIVAQSGEASQPEPEVPNRPSSAEDVLKLPPSEENIPFLPIFSSRQLVDFAMNDLHPEFHGAARLQDFGFSVRTSKILQRLGLETIGEVMFFPSGELLSQKNFGRKSLKEVRSIIRSFALGGNVAQTGIGARESSETHPEIDYSSYARLVASFVGHCMKSRRNQAIVCNRLDFPAVMPTLEELGERFGLITRERVRQILKRGNALLRVKAHRELLSEFWELVTRLIREGGGIASTRDLAESLGEECGWPGNPNPAALTELLAVAEEEKTLVVSGDVVTAPCPCPACETPREHIAALDFEANESYHLFVVGDKLVRHCQSRCQTHSPRRFHRAFIEKMVKDCDGEYQLHGDLVFPKDRWLTRHGKGLKELIVHVLENNGKPMHFSEIAAAIRKENIKHREISDHSVHAAMCRYDSIEIIQRGTYGLKAWGAGGYRSVSTAIEELLDADGLPMRRSEIINSLAGEFSEDNISAALHTWGNRFVSIGEGFYDRPERWRKRSVSQLIGLLPDALANLARYLTTSNNCSYKLVLALVFIRGMGDRGAYSLSALKERFYNFYLGRHKKGEVVEADNVLMQRIGELSAAEIRSKAIKEPMKSFINSGFWSQRSSSLYLQESLVALLVDASFRSRLLITLLKGIDDYFAAISPQPPSREQCRNMLDIPEEEPINPHGESTISISIKTKVRGKITL